MSGRSSYDLISDERLPIEQDLAGVWRAYVNDALAGPYQALFAPISFQILLRPLNGRA